MHTDTQPEKLAARQVPWGLVLALSTAVGMVLAAYLWWLRLTSLTHPGCYFSGDCSYTWFSLWATWCGLPVSALALIPYSGMLLGWGLVTKNRQAGLGRALLAAMSVFLVLMAIWFLALQALLLKRWCPLCVGSQAVSLCTAALAVIFLRKRPSAPLVPWISGKACFTGSLLALAVIISHSTTGKPNADGWYKPLGKGTLLQRPSTGVLINERLVDIQQDALIVSGSIDAPQLVVILTDYTDADCRRLHQQLPHVLAAAPVSYCQAILPVPLDSAANPVIEGMNRPEATEIARLACIVGKLKPEAFPQFHRWLISGPNAPSAASVRQQVSQLIPGINLEKELAEADNFRPLQMGLATHLTNKHKTVTALPVLMTEKATFFGAPANIDSLVREFQKAAR